MFIGIGLTTFLLHVAMITYRGGNRFAESPQNFNFSLNFLSELGFTEGWNGNKNLIPQFFFCLSILTAGLCTICYIRQFPENFPLKSKSRKLSKIGTYFGWISLGGYFGIICIPGDINRIFHLTMVLVAFGGIPFVFLFYGIAGLKQPLIPPAISYLSFSLFGGMFSYFCILLLGPSVFSVNTVKFQIIAQKIALSFQIVHFSLIGWLTFCWEFKLVRISNNTSNHKLFAKKNMKSQSLLVFMLIKNHLSYRKHLLVNYRQFLLPK